VLGFLRGVRVLDLSQYLPGPFAARMLADMGAEVVKVEPPGGDPVRSLDLEGKPGRSVIYPLLNAGKTIVNVDLKAPEGRDCLTELVRVADVLLESFRPGVLERLGFGPERLQEINPSLIHCALSGFGQTGPLRLTAGHDINYEAMTGGLSVAGTEETPTVPFPPVADYAGALQAVIAVLGALVGRDHGQPGCLLDVSAMESLLAWQEIGMTAPPARVGGLINGGCAGYQIYRTADGKFVSLSALEVKFWDNFCIAVGRPDLIARRFEPMPQKALIADLKALFASQTRDHWQALLQDVDCCFQPVWEYGELATHPHIAARGFVNACADYVEVLFPVIVDGAAPLPRQPFRDADVGDVLAAWHRG
jgi:crotonobetainyl-CoA:carnitine CoA-transferase CaiB-like acyl-CoA transferase